MTRPARHPLLANALTFVAAAAAVCWLWSVDVPPPRWTTFTDTRVLSASDLTEVVTHATRVLATALLAYLVVASALNLLAWLCLARGRATGLARWSSRLAPRWLAVASIGVIAGTPMLTPAAGAVTDDHSGARRDDVLLEVVTADDEPTDTTGATGATDPGPRTMLPWAASTTPPTVSTTTTSIPEPPRLAPADPSGSGSAPVGVDQLPPPLVIERATSGAAAQLHTVRPGDHFWGIAERVVSERGLAVPVADYWRLLVEANRARLADPADADLIYPGQVLVLP